MSSDFGTATVDSTDKLTGYPQDKIGHLLDPFDHGNGFTKWRKGTTLTNLTDPYGCLHFAVGTSDDFFCFDYAKEVSPSCGEFIVLHSVINSETGSYIMSHTYDTLPINTDEERVGALNCAARMLDDAVAWLNENDLKHERKGRNQDRLYFLRAVFAQLYPDEVMKLDRKRGKRVSWLTNRMKRFGGKKIDLMVAQRLNY